MKRVFILIFNFMSMNALAGYECDFKLAHTEGLYATIATKKEHIDIRMKYGSNVETVNKRKK